MSTQNERELRDLFEKDQAHKGYDFTKNKDGGYVFCEAYAAFGYWKINRAPLLSRIAELQQEVDFLKGSLAGAESIVTSQRNEIKAAQDRIDALSKDAERYRWLTTHYKYTNDSMAELWFDKGVENSDSKESIDRSIDAAISAREGE